MAKTPVLLLLVLAFSNALHAYYEDNPQFPFGKVTFEATRGGFLRGQFLARCAGCAPGPETDPASVEEISPSEPRAIWTAQKVGDKIALKADNGKYLAFCNGCWGRLGYPDSAFVSATSAVNNPLALWTPEYLVDGRWALYSEYHGSYLGRCVGCVFNVRDRAFAFVHMNRATNSPAVWQVRSS